MPWHVALFVLTHAWDYVAEIYKRTFPCIQGNINISRVYLGRMCTFSILLWNEFPKWWCRLYYLCSSAMTISIVLYLELPDFNFFRPGVDPFNLNSWFPEMLIRFLCFLDIQAFSSVNCLLLSWPIFLLVFSLSYRLEGIYIVLCLKECLGGSVG